METKERTLTNEEIEALKKIEEYFVPENSNMTKNQKLNYTLTIAKFILEGRDAIHKTNFLNLPHSLTEIEKIPEAPENDPKTIKVFIRTIPTLTKK